MFRSAPSFGIYITDTEIIAGSARRSKEIITVFARGKRSLPEGLIKDGVIEKPGECGKILKDLLLSLRLSTIIKNPMIVVPPQKVLSTLINVPQKGKKNEKEKIKQEAMSKILPEEISKLSVISVPLAKLKDKTELVGIAAMRSDQLDSIRKTCKEAGVAPKQIISASAACFGALPEGEKSGLLISSAPESTVTLYYLGFPVDEAIFTPDAKQNEILSEAKSILEDADSRNIPINNAWVIGTPALLGKTRELLKEMNVDSEAVMVLKDLNSKKEDQEFLPAMAASLIKKEITVDFLSSQQKSLPETKKQTPEVEEKPKREKSTKQKSGGLRLIMMLLLLAIVTFASGALVYYTRIASKPTEVLRSWDAQEPLEIPEITPEEEKSEPESVPEVLTGATVEQGTGAIVETGTGASAEMGTGATAP